jgi:hypothetical protein
MLSGPCASLRECLIGAMLERSLLHYHWNILDEVYSEVDVQDVLLSCNMCEVFGRRLKGGGSSSKVQALVMGYAAWSHAQAYSLMERSLEEQLPVCSICW